MADQLRAVGSRRELTVALDDEQLAVHFQPVVDLRTARIRGVEALLRWDHPEHGLLPAAAFLPAVDGTPVMLEVTRFVLTEACRAVAAGAPPGWSLSVNITAADAAREALLDEVAAALELAGMPAARLVLEVTETGLLSNLDDSARVLRRLTSTGVTVALDDFGSGYSSLRLLRELPISELKVDALFVRQLDTNAGDAAIVGNVIRLADAFGASVVAEGVEHVGQAAVLRQLGCKFGQGFLWSRPAPLAEVRALDLPAQPTDGRPPEAVRARVRALFAGGASPHSVAAALNGEGVRTPDGRRWHPRSVEALRRELDGAG